MATGTMHADDNGIAAMIVFKDRKGNVATVATVPVWTLSADGIVAMAVSGDGMSATFTPITVGSVDIDVVAEGDPTPGVDTIHGIGTIQVLPAEASVAEVSFGPVS